MANWCLFARASEILQGRSSSCVYGVFSPLASLTLSFWRVIKGGGAQGQSGRRREAASRASGSLRGLLASRALDTFDNSELALGRERSTKCKGPVLAPIYIMDIHRGDLYNFTRSPPPPSTFFSRGPLLLCAANDFERRREAGYIRASPAGKT